MTARFVVAEDDRVYIVDEHGCMLNTEAVCQIDTVFHEWFKEWIQEQPCPYNDDLLWHPALGEDVKSYHESLDNK